MRGKRRRGLSLTGSFLRPPGCPCHTSAAPYHTRLNEVHGSRLSVLRRHTALVFCSFSTSLFCVLSRWDNQSPTICRVVVFVDLSTLYKFSQSGEHSKAWYSYAKYREVMIKSASCSLYYLHGYELFLRTHWSFSLSGPSGLSANMSCVMQGEQCPLELEASRHLDWSWFGLKILVCREEILQKEVSISNKCGIPGKLGHCPC